MIESPRSRRAPRTAAPFVTILVIATAATLADWIWYTFGVRHSVAAGLIHGAVQLTFLGGGLGAAAGRLLRGLPIGTLAGIGGALAYYAFIAAFGGQTYGAAIPASWIVMWLLLAVMEGRWLRDPSRGWIEIAVRGAAAAVLSGLTFYLVVGTLWGPPPAEGRSYALQFVAWAVAWGPGVLALTLEAPGREPHRGEE